MRHLIRLQFRFTNITLKYKSRISNIILKLYLVKLGLQYIRISVRKIAHYSNRKLETILYA